MTEPDLATAAHEDAGSLVRAPLAWEPRRMRPARPCLALLVSVVLGAGCVDEGLDDVRWACATDGACGPAAHCVRGFCAPRGVQALSGGLTCTLPALSSDDPSAPRFAIALDEGNRQLVFSARGREARVALPAEVVSLDEGPLTTCCTNPCCAFSRP